MYDIGLFPKHCTCTMIYKTVGTIWWSRPNPWEAGRFWSQFLLDFPTNQTLHQFHDLDTELDLHRLSVVSMEHLQRLWHASRERLPLRTPGSVPFLGACVCSDCWDQFPRLFTDLMTYRSWLLPNWEVSMEHLQQVWHASRERLPFRTPGSVPHFGTC